MARKKTTARRTTTAKRATKATTRPPAIEGQTPLRVHADIGAKAAAKPRGVAAPTPTTTLRRGRMDDFAPTPHAELKLPVQVATDAPVKPARIRARRSSLKI